jgi:hypothetical protein
MFGRLRRNVRAAISGSTALSVVLLTAILGALGAGISYLSGFTTIGYGIGVGALLTGIVEFATLYENPAVPTTATITLKAFLYIVAGGVLVGLEYLLQQTAYTTATALATAAIVVAYVLQQVTAAGKVYFAKKP